jgi:protein-S-isoprenylcysteine O-methyltransferase Ste14
MLRKTSESKTLRRGSFDRGSTLLIGAGFGFGLLLPLVVDYFGVAVFSLVLLEGLLAIGTMVLGLMLRIWAAATLGHYYSRTLQIAQNQKLVTSGPYARIRHPGYLGGLLLWSGFGVVSSNLVVMLVFPVMFLVIYLYRIAVEERMMVKELGPEYMQYQSRTRKLIPFIY